MSGTPKTLREAISNGLTNLVFADDSAEHIEDHVRDYLSQHFATAMLEHPGCDTILSKLWEKIKKKERV